MRHVPLIPSMLLLAMTMASAGCARDAATPASTETVPDAAPHDDAGPPSNRDVPVPPTSAGAIPLEDGIRYRCDDGSRVQVAYVDDQAHVTLADGSKVTLPKAQSASKGSGDAYVGETLSLQREGDALQLHQDEAATRRCLRADGASAP